MGSILAAVTLPDVGGDTMFASLGAAYDTLAEPLRELCDELTAYHYDFPAAQGDALLRLLYDHSTRPEFVCRYRWEPGTVGFWDNRATMHFGINDYGAARRVMHRVTLRGDRPVGIA
jgi:alpha-ketoglutarate-dependent taurine dioxygenase